MKIRTLYMFFIAFLIPIDLEAATLGRWSSKFIMRKVENGAPSNALHVVEVYCDKKDCEWTAVTLNQCMFGSFYPKIEQHATNTPHKNSMRMYAHSPNERTFDLDFALAKMTVKVKGECDDDARKHFGRDYCKFTVRNLSGAIIADSGEINTMKLELVPFSGAGVKLNCQMSLSDNDSVEREKR